MSTVNGLKAGVSASQRFKGDFRCPICKGTDDDPRGNGSRCYGFLSGDGQWAHCTREDHAGRAVFNPKTSSYQHKVKGPCPCHAEHSPADLGTMNGKPKIKSRGTIAAVYEYHRVEGGPVDFEAVRMKDPKGFFQRRRGGDGKWIYKNIFAESDPFLYRRPELLAAPPNKIILIVEGEKDVENLRALGYTATTNPMGEGKWRDAYSEDLRGRRVAIIPDNDQVGHSHSLQVARSVWGKAAAVRIVPIPGLPPKGDVSDFLAAGGTADDLDRLIHEAAPWEPDEEPAQAKAEPSSNGDGHRGDETAADEDREAQAATEETTCSPDMEANPHRLARLFRDRRFSHPDRHKIAYWQGQFHGWRRGAYGAIPAQEMRAELATVIEGEFTRLHTIACTKFKNSQRGGKSDGLGDKSKPPQMRAVTTTLVADVLQALSGLVLLKLDDYPEMPAWLDDAPPWPAEEVLPAANALVHLPSLVANEGSILPPTPTFFSSYALDYEFDADAPQPVNWLTFLGKIPVTKDSKVKLQLWPRDPDSIDFLQEWFGYHLGRGSDQQKALAMIGPKRSGKGTIAFMLGAMIGTENVAGPTLSGLSTQFGLQSLIGKPCAIIDDARLSGKTDVAVLVERLLSITGQGKMNVPRKNQLDWVGTLTSKFTIITNETPRLPDSSEAIASRLMFLHLTESFYGREDHALKAKLLPELPGILLWAIEGWRRLRDRGHFVQPKSGQKLAREMAELGSPIGAFLKERCTVMAGREILAAELYWAWKSWCAEKGREHPGDEQGFGRNLRSVMPNLATMSKRQPDLSRKRVYQGISLKTVEDLAGDNTGDVEI